MTHWLTNVEVVGAENIPAKGPTLAVMNHFSIFDIPIITYHIAPKLPTFFSAQAVGKNAWARPILWAFEGNHITVRRGKFDRTVLREGLDYLSRDEFVVIMPEGGVDNDTMPMSLAGVAPEFWPPASNSRLTGQLMAGRTGAAFIAAKAQVPILPLGATGIQFVEGNVKKLKRTDVTVNVGKPFMLDSIEGLRGKERKERLSADTDRIMLEIAKLLPRENRGTYKDRIKEKVEREK